jgi:hypothetical protein
VDSELPAAGNYYDHAAGGGMWVALAEKAYAQANAAGWVTTQYASTNSYAALNIGSPTWALTAITGKSASSFAINPTNLAAAWRQGQIIVIATGSAPASSYLVPSHAYAVVAFNATSNTPFQVYNPWGTDSTGWYPGLYNGHRVYGLFSASGNFLSQNFWAQSLGP